MRKRADQTRGCPAPEQTEAGADLAPMLSREHQQAEAGRDGTALQSDGATAGGVGTALRRTHSRPGWQQIAHPAELRGVRQAQTNPKGESQRAERASHAGVLRVWVESAGAHGRRNPFAAGHETRADPGVCGKVAGALALSSAAQS